MTSAKVQFSGLSHVFSANQIFGFDSELVQSEGKLVNGGQCWTS